MADEPTVEQINRMIDEGPTEEEIRKAVDSYLNSQVFDYESKNQIVRRLVQLKFQGRPLDSPGRSPASGCQRRVCRRCF